MNKRQINMVKDSRALYHPKYPEPQINRRTGKHLKKCRCYDCVLARFAEYRKRVKNMSDVKYPESMDQLVPVRAHYRRHPGYLRNQPEMKRLVEGLVRLMLKQRK